MTSSGKKLITLSVLLLGTAALIVAAITFQRPLRERYWLWKLESGGTKEERLTAAERLEELGSVRAIPSLIDALAAAMEAKEAVDRFRDRSRWWVNRDTSQLYIPIRPYVAAIQSISNRTPDRTKEFLRSYLSDDREIARAIAASILYEGTRGAQEYVSPTRLLSIPGVAQEGDGGGGIGKTKATSTLAPGTETPSAR